MHAAGKQVLILSGDRAAPVQALAQRLGIDDWRWGLSAEDKRDAVVKLQAEGAVVAMVGDGVNDALVLARAELSVAMGSGAELAQAGADIVLLGGQLDRFSDALGVSRQTLRVITQNLRWAAAYNLVALPVALSGWMPPWLAGLGMAASSLGVVLNALRLHGPAPRLRALEPGLPDPVRV